MTQINLDDLLDPKYLQRYAPGLTEAIAEYLREASLVCLEHHNHKSGVILKLDGSQAPRQSPALVWQAGLPANAPQAHADLQDATEDGAVAIAVLLVAKYTDYRVITRAAKGNGFDYYLGKQAASDSFNFLADATAQLEVSGILEEKGSNTRRRRLAQKRRRLQKYNTPGSSFIIIVAFDTLSATMEFEI